MSLFSRIQVSAVVASLFAGSIPALAETPDPSFVIRHHFLESGVDLAETKKETIQEALGIVSRRMFSERVLRCADNNSVRAQPDLAVNRRIDQVRRADSIRLSIEPLENPCYPGGINMPGWAIRGSAAISRTTTGKTFANFTIKLNYNCIDDVYDSPDFWAGVITHEMGHQMGLTHKNMPSQGTYVYEWGNCVEHDSKTAGLYR